MLDQQSSQVKLKAGYSKTPCDGCKGHHIKCDKNLNGCKNCTRRDIPCTYLITRKRRGPKTKVESMMKLLESLNTANQSSSASSATTTNQTSLTLSVDTKTTQASSDPQSSDLSSPMQATPTLPDDFSLNQAISHDFPVSYQDIYSLPVLDTNIYDLPLLPSDLTSFEPSLTIPITYDPLQSNCWYSELDALNHTELSSIQSECFQNSFFNDYSENQFY
ncbi:hypothetical protein CONCODRAFT_77426 [Conidiobolus coronatus NRRL 28638]|uniref:Zn(2)-C6 fungal-type domain-containing protein n=1 Tax=Conidiobolus coronatus (strain ATCC 28846 / CBS 209.66 / NRRL 28638) TaxID=796925 RepID=A0A137PE55_CONC2|nr:hypothetical protein CONCODRAFT_77426 [Conidiobolus coronatus NRRL 28638]|eukprot:KXN73286.1 hypothetical protein CONCODRAFT_77426 [Conidiobolus coronatus NRRL 28638]